MTAWLVTVLIVTWSNKTFRDLSFFLHSFPVINVGFSKRLPHAIGIRSAGLGAFFVTLTTSTPFSDCACTWEVSASSGSRNTLSRNLCCLLNTRCGVADGVDVPAECDRAAWLRLQRRDGETKRRGSHQMKSKKPTTVIIIKAPKKRNPAARVVNQKAQTIADGPRRQATRDAKDRAILKDQGVL